VAQKQEPWSDSERAALEHLAKQHEHRKWLLDIVKRWATWVAAFSLASTVTWDALLKLVRFITGL
jgi:hypothetical protein